MPLSNANKRVLHDQQKNEEENNRKKRRLSDSSISPLHKRIKDTENPADMNDSQKRANFSALASPGTNGISRHASPLASNKPGTTKKLVIKNFKGEQEIAFKKANSHYARKSRILKMIFYFFFFHFSFNGPSRMFTSC